MACSTVWKNPKHSVKLSAALFDLSMRSLNSDLDSWHSSSPPQLTDIFSAATSSRRDASMERERFVFTACSFILSLLAGCGEEQYRVPCCTHKGAGMQERRWGRAGVLPSGFSPFTSASFGTDQLAEEPGGFWIMRACNGASPLSPSQLPF